VKFLAGAKKVVSIDNSKIIANKARKIVARNGYSHIINVITGDVKTISLPFLEAEKCDVIISEWMGYGLYFENMLASVLVARDRYLAPGGLLLPNVASIFIQGMTTNSVDSQSDKVNWWANIYGFDLSDMADIVTKEAQVQDVQPGEIITNRYCAHSLNIESAKTADLDFECPFKLVWFILCSMHISYYK
jgi:hypothetical protein